MSQLLEKIQSEMLAAMKAQQAVRRDILKFVIAESKTLEIRQRKPITDDQILKVVGKIIENNQESIGYLPEHDARYSKLKEENVILASLMPKTISLEETLQILSGVDEIRTAEKEGNAIGAAMKFLKSSGKKDFDNKLVTEAVKRLRSG